jgi:mono/diheme cytochrome c family protein
MSRIVLLFALAFASFVAACATAPHQSSPGASAEPSPAGRGLAFAKRHCAACHGIEVDHSPKPDAPPFAAIVNKVGLTEETLGTWLRDSHNYPEIMAFEVDPSQISDLSAYMLTLKDPTYRPAIQ